MRMVRIATVSFLVDETPHTIELNLQRSLDYMTEAARRGADIVCLPENVITTNVEEGERSFAESFPGEITSAFCERAKDAGLHVIAPYAVSENGRTYGQATVISREGEVTGYYRKTHLTGVEAQTLVPGDELPVFHMDFGTIAVQLCLDMYFPEIVRVYTAKGAEVVFWPTVTHGPTQEALSIQLRARAVDNSVIMVESNLAGHPPYAPYEGRYYPGTARIVDDNGDVLAQTGRRHGVAVADVDLDAVRLTKGCVLLRHPDHMREDILRVARMDLFAREYARIASGKKNEKDHE